MPILRIPKEVYPGFESILRLDDDSANQIIASLSEAAYSPKPARVIASMQAIVNLVPSEEVELISTVIASLYGVCNQPEQSLGEFANELVEVVERTNELQKPEQWEREKAVNFFERALSVEGALSIAVKAIGVLNDHEHVFCEARVLTDLRPIFGSEVSSTPTSVVMIHNLKIVYQQGEDQKEFFVALDTNDIRALQIVLARAENKTISLKTVLEKAALHYLDVEDKG
jgi:hypothetical protein